MGSFTGSFTIVASEISGAIFFGASLLSLAKRNGMGVAAAGDAATSSSAACSFAAGPFAGFSLIIVSSSCVLLRAPRLHRVDQPFVAGLRGDERRLHKAKFACALGRARSDDH